MSLQKISEQKDILNTLRELVIKEANNPVATGKPGADTKVQAIDPKHENHDKNQIGADKNGPQAHEQHKATDPSTPVQKTSEEAVEEAPAEKKSVEKLAEEILAHIQKTAEKPKATGKPGADTKYQAVSAEAEKHNKNEIGADKNAPQSFEQHKATDPSAPLKKAELSDEDLEKLSSYVLGQKIAEMNFKMAHERDLGMAKLSGRRAFEEMITQAAAELETTQTKTANDNSMLEKQAEEAGANYFNELMKQAQAEYAVNQLVAQNQALAKQAQDLAQEVAYVKQAASQVIAEKQAELQKQVQEREDLAKWASMADYVKTQVLEGLKQELTRGGNPA